MPEKFRLTIENKEAIMKIAGVLIILSVALLSFDVFSSDTDQRKQIIDEEPEIQTTLCSMLTSIEGVGQVEVMINYNNENQVSGVLVVAEGAENPVIKNNLVSAVKGVFSIPASSVVVLEMDAESRGNGGTVNE